MKCKKPRCWNAPKTTPEKEPRKQPGDADRIAPRSTEGGSSGTKEADRSFSRS